jgi:hypothetical protein
VMLIELGLLRDRLRVADHAVDARLRHCPGLQDHESRAAGRYDPRVPGKAPPGLECLGLRSRTATNC